MRRVWPSNEWNDSTLVSRLDDKTEDAIVVVMQRLHVEDLVGHLLETGPEGWVHLEPARLSPRRTR